MTKSPEMIGKRFGRLVVLIAAGKTAAAKPLWECACDCGAIHTAIGAQLRSGKTRSCGCLQRKGASKSLEGKRFGRWRVLKEAGISNRKQKWRCVCDCGAKSDIPRGNLTSGLTKSCGCKIRDFFKKRTGASNPAWNASLTDEDRKNQRPGQWRWAAMIIAKDGHKCRKCGATKGTLCAHHIEPFHKRKDLALDPKNGACLCVSCHIKFHSIYGKRKFTADDFYLFINQLRESRR